MKTILKQLPNFLGSRIALNIYFWLLLLFCQFVLNFVGENRVYYYPVGWYYLFRAITVIALAALLYANNLWLVPAFLVKKKRSAYFFRLLTLTYAVGICYSLLFRMLAVHFPKMAINDVSAIGALAIKYPTRWYYLIFFQAISWQLVFLGLVFLFTVSWYMHAYQQQKKISEAAQQKQIETELIFLKSQINPHFLFNTLNNLYTLTLKKSDDAPDVVSKLSVILRYLLYESNTGEVSFEKEKEMMESYIDIELLRIANKENFHFSITSDRPCTIPPLLWMPVLENVFKHGTRYISTAYFVEYRCSIQANTLYIYSKNGFKDAAGDKQAGGIGLTNLRKRLALLYPGNHSMRTGAEGEYFVTEVKIQLA